MKRKPKKGEGPKLWNPERITPIITSTGLAIGSQYQPPIRGEMTYEELWVQSLFIKPGTPLPNKHLADYAMRVATILITALIIYLITRR
jgi:hypothetical protein